MMKTSTQMNSVTSSVSKLELDCKTIAHYFQETFQLSNEVFNKYYGHILESSKTTDAVQNTMVLEMFEKYKKNGVLLSLPVGFGKTRMIIEVSRLITLASERNVQFAFPTAVLRAEKKKENLNQTSSSTGADKESKPSCILPGLIVVCLPVQIIEQWKNEIERMYPETPVFVFHGSNWSVKDSILEEISQTIGFRFFLTSVFTILSCFKYIVHNCNVNVQDKRYFKLTSHSSKFLKNTLAVSVANKMMEHVIKRCSLLVIDEVHIATRDFDNAIQQFFSKLKCKKIGISATPIMNSFEEVLSELNAIDPIHMTMREFEKNIPRSLQAYHLRSQFFVSRRSEDLQLTRAERNEISYYVNLNTDESKLFHDQLDKTWCVWNQLQHAQNSHDFMRIQALTRCLFQCITRLRMVNMCAFLPFFLSDMVTFQESYDREKSALEGLIEPHQEGESGTAEKHEQQDNLKFYSEQVGIDEYDTVHDDTVHDEDDIFGKSDDKESPLSPVISKRGERDVKTSLIGSVLPLLNSSSDLSQLAERYKSGRLQLASQWARKLTEISQRFRELVELLENLMNESKKTLLFCEFPSFFDILSAALNHKKVCQLIGSMSRVNREKSLVSWKSGETPLILISTKCGGVGLNMPEAEAVIFLTLPMNPASYEQSIGRADRRDRVVGKIDIFLVTSFLDMFATRFTTHVRKQAEAKNGNTVASSLSPHDEKNACNSDTQRNRSFLETVNLHATYIPLVRDKIKPLSSYDGLASKIIADKLIEMDEINCIAGKGLKQVDNTIFFNGVNDVGAVRRLKFKQERKRKSDPLWKQESPEKRISFSTSSTSSTPLNN